MIIEISFIFLQIHLLNAYIFYVTFCDQIFKCFYRKCAYFDVVGTFITELTEGKLICADILKDTQTMLLFVNALVDICVKFKLDGWLLNVENSLDETGLLKTFVRHLTIQMHARRPGSLVIWYDSVTCNGQLKWQNELNDLNR